ncbi:MAG: hypothetical protein ACK52U_16275 [Synechococcaceae cyanobacterium]
MVPLVRQQAVGDGLAKPFFARCCGDEEIRAGSATVLHADNRAPMRSTPAAAIRLELEPGIE